MADHGMVEQKARIVEVPRIVMYGASGHALAIALNGRHRLLARPLCEVVAYIDDFRGEQGLTLDEVPIISFDRWRREFVYLGCFIAVGDPRARRRLAQRISSHGGFFVPFYLHSDVAIPHASIGVGTIVAATSDVGPQSSLGDHVIVMPMSWIAHDVTIGNYVSIGASCSISGHVVIEDDVFVGAGVTVVNGRAGKPLKIGAGAKIAAGAVVTKSIPAKASVAGNPARPLREIVRDRRERGQV